jgi:hypothetical protein
MNQKIYRYFCNCCGITILTLGRMRKPVSRTLVCKCCGYKGRIGAEKAY